MIGTINYNRIGIIHVENVWVNVSPNTVCVTDTSWVEWVEWVKEPEGEEKNGKND